MKSFGTGSDLQRAIQAATVQGLAGGDIASAVAGGAVPWLADVIHSMATTKDASGNVVVNTQANLMAHAVLEQKVSALATVAAGLAGVITGDSTADAVAGAQAGKNAVENNALGNVLAAAEANKSGTIDKWQEQQQAAIREACSGGTPISCETAVAAAGSIMVLPLLPELMVTSGLIGASANAGIGYVFNGKVNPNDAILGFWTGSLSAYTGFTGTVSINAIGGATSSYLKGDDPVFGAIISGTGAGLGYGVSKTAEKIMNNMFNPTWKSFEWTNLDMGISKPFIPSTAPGTYGTAGGSLTTEMFNDQAAKGLSKTKSEVK